MVSIIVMGGNVILFFHGGVSLLTGIALYKEQQLNANNNNNDG